MQNYKKAIPGPIKKIAYSALHLPRLVSSKLRVLPDFIIIGAQRSGTTSLFSYLLRHPQIMGSFQKEVHFFDHNYDKSKEWYRSFFPLEYQIKSGDICGEASPYYLFYPHTAERIHKLLPEIKLLALLRNPTERAISHYFHEVRRNREHLPIMEALQAEEERTSSEQARIYEDENYRSEVHLSFSYKQRGHYVDQLERYSRFFTQEQVLVLNSEKFFTAPHQVLKQVFLYFGVDSDFIPKDLLPKNVGSNRRKVSASVYKYLDEYYAPHNERLYEHLGQSFGW